MFLYPSLTWAFLLVLVPLVIHLINLMRQKRIEWAAMEFLLQSYKKHRRWVWLKQLLLLLLRMLVIAAAVAMLAGLVTQDQSSFLGGQTTHHFILLDDSLSMADRSSSGRAFDLASQALHRIAQQLATQTSAQKVTLIRFSQAAKNTAGGVSTADMNAVTVDSEFAQTMEEVKRRFDVSELAVGPGPALEMADQLMRYAVEQQRVTYVLSDFRARQWHQSTDIKEALRLLHNNDSALHLIRCAETQHQNLAVLEITPEPGTWAAGVPILVNVQVKNYGPSSAQQVSVRISARSYPSDVLIVPGQDVDEQQVTLVSIDEIPAGEVATRQAQLKFDRAGQHIVEATLVADSLAEDNVARCLLEIPEEVPVLVIDGSGRGEESYYLQSVFAPGRIVTGIRPTPRDPTYLRDAVDTELARFAAIYILNVERLDPKAIEGLNRYVRGGGGLAWFVGPNTDPAFLVAAYAEGDGPFPIPVQSERANDRSLEDEASDLQVHDHPIFRALVSEGGDSRPLSRGIRVDRFLAVDPDWQPQLDPQVQILATIRDQLPLVVAKPSGDGQIVAFLTTASPTWNNWAMGPSYPVVLLQLHGFLVSNQESVQFATAGEPITMQLDTTEYRPEVEFVLPRSDLEGGASRPVSVRQVAEVAAGDSSQVALRIGEGISGATDTSGVYLAKLTTVDGQSRQKRFVANVPTAESELSILTSLELSEQLDELNVQIHSAEALEYQSQQQQGFSWSHLLAGLLIALMLGEQVLAYSASYHPRRGVR